MAMPERIEAEALVLVRATPAHATEVAAAVRASWREINPFMPWATEQYGEREAWDWTSATWGAWGRKEAYEYVMTDAADGSFVGTVGLNAIRHRCANLGYWVHSARTGRGFCTMAARAVARAGFEHGDLARIHLRHMLANVASQRIAEKVGFQREGRIRSLMQVHGERVDLIQYSLIDASEIR